MLSMQKYEHSISRRKPDENKDWVDILIGMAEPGYIPLFNDGSCVHPRSITGIEIQNGSIALVKWWMNTKRNIEPGASPFSRMDRTVYIDRQLIMSDQTNAPILPIRLANLP